MKLEYRVREITRYIVTEYHEASPDTPQGSGVREVCGPTTQTQANEIAAMYGAAHPEAQIFLLENEGPSVG